LVVTLLLQTIGGEATILVASAAAFSAAACLTMKRRSLAVVFAIAGVICALANERLSLLRVIPGTIKAMRKDMDLHPNAKVAQEGWNAYSRISAVEGVTGLARLYIDSDAWTSVYPWDGHKSKVVPDRRGVNARESDFEHQPGECCQEDACTYELLIHKAGLDRSYRLRVRVANFWKRGTVSNFQCPRFTRKTGTLEIAHCPPFPPFPRS